MMRLIDVWSYDGLLFLTIAWCGYLVLSIYLHELGHLFMLRRLGFSEATVTLRGADFHAGEEYMYTDGRAKSVYWAGIIAGLPPIMFFSLIGSWPFTVLLLLLYAAGCTTDVRALLR